jgi:hypothetical protein
LRKFPFHPFLIFIFPVLSLLANNIQELSLREVIRPIVVLLIIAGLILIFFKLIFKDLFKAAIITSYVGLVFFSYGHLYDYLRSTPIFGMNFGRHSILGTVFILAVIAGFILLARIKDYKLDTTLFVNVISIVLVIMPLWQIIRYETRPKTKPEGTSGTSIALTDWQNQTLIEGPNKLTYSGTGQLPDIYLIILDMYGRQDSLKQDLGFDNSDFINQLKKMGFYVAPCSRSNYAQTRFSLSNLLNMNYIQKISGSQNMDDILEEGIKHSLVRTELEKMGYKTAAFATGFPFSEITDTDLYMEPQAPSFFNPTIQPFEGLIIKGSLLRLPIDLHPTFLAKFLNQLTFPYSGYIQRVHTTLDGLKSIAGKETPKFVFAHLMIPHPPYIFNADGSIRVDNRYYREALNQPISEEFFQEGYKLNLQYTNRAILPVLQEIIQTSVVPPVIILASDHGIRDDNRMENLAALYVPGTIKNPFYSTITPVNYFRLVFNEMFNGSFPVLEDLSYYSGYPDRYDLSQVEETFPDCIIKSP